MKQLFIIIFSFFTVAAFAQTKDVVKLSYEARKKANGQYDVAITATLQKPWHIYSQNTEKGGPLPTKINFSPNPLVTLQGKVKEEGKLEKVYDENFKKNVLYYSNKVVFVQTVKLKGNVQTNITGTIEYMVCDDEMCLPPVKKSFDIQLK